MMKSIDRLLASRLFLKVISLLVATLVWYYIAADRGTEVVRTVTVPVEFLNVPADMSVTSKVRDVDVQVSGTRESASSLSGTIASQVDLKGLEPGVHREPVHAVLPSGVRLVEVSPPYVDLELTKMGSRLLPVKLGTPDDLPPGHRVEDVLISPGEVTVKGSEEELALLENVWVLPTLDQIQTQNEIVLPIISSTGNTGKDPFLAEPGQVTLSFTLVRGFPRKVVPVRIETVGDPGMDFQIEAVAVDPPEVTIQGPLESVERIEELFLPPLDVEGITSDITRVVPIERPADDVEVVLDNSVNVKILLTQRIENRLYARIPVQISGKSIYQGWRIDPLEANVFLEGSPSDLDAAESMGSPVEVFVDVTNLVSTKIRVPLQFKIKGKGLKMSLIEPAVVTVYALTE
ncbi:MAG: CdaR family protein [Thermovirgaceae bacterium]|nr:CdaR family protein [Thermovirgaceae bacterium]